MLTPEREAEIRVIAKTKGYAKRQEWWDDVAGDLLAEIDRLRAELAKYEHEAAARENTDAHNRRLIAERDEARAEVERLREQANADLRSFNAMGDQMRAARADAIRLAEALQREAEQSADGGIPESWAALARHDERVKP